MSKRSGVSVGGKRGTLLRPERFFGRHIFKGNLPTLTMRVSLSPDISKWSRFRALWARASVRLLGRVWPRPGITDGNLESDSEKIAWR